MVLRVNENKTKHKCVTRQSTTRRHRIRQNVSMKNFNFERFRSFKYLGVIITDDTDMHGEIIARIIT